MGKRIKLSGPRTKWECGYYGYNAGDIWPIMQLSMFTRCSNLCGKKDGAWLYKEINNMTKSSYKWHCQKLYKEINRRKKKEKQTIEREQDQQ